MNYKFISLFFFTLLLSCQQINSNKNDKIYFDIQNKFKNSGFALVYSENLSEIKSLETRSLDIYHKSLKKKTNVKILNPKNGKFVIANVKSNKIRFSNFYNSVISPRIAEDLSLNLDEPFIEIISISKGSTFIAKKAKTFDEEKSVAEKAPIDGVKISNLNLKPKKIKKNKKELFSYSIKVADFYYKDSAKLMLSRIQNETSIKNLQIIRLSKTKYRLLIGPFDDIKSLKNSFEMMNILNFENLEIIKNV